jgi:hypothetical protein
LRGLRVVRFLDTIIIRFRVDVASAEVATQLYVWTYMDPDIFRVPEPYRFFQDESQGLALTTRYLVIEYIDGTCLSTYFESANSQTVVSGVSKALHHLSAVTLPVGQGPGPVGGGPPRCYLWEIVALYRSLFLSRRWIAG